jgi:sigma-B regulation protein RsbU (phosphoserine phosphatase)
MIREESLTLVRRLINAAAERDPSQLAKFYAFDAVAVSPVFGTISGRAAIAATWQTLFSTLSDVVIEVSDVLVDGDRIAVLSRITTSAATGLFGSSAGGAVRYQLVLLLTIADGRIIRDERIYDSTGVAERLEKARLDRELKTAAELQRALMGQTEHTRTFCKSVGDSIPCRAIGGDFFEFIELPRGDAGIVIGDVAGKGPAAALLAAMIQGMFASEAASGGTPSHVLSAINRLLVARRVNPRFATLVYCVLSPNGQLLYSSAGHNPPFLLTRSGIRRLTTGGLILGAFPGSAFQEETICMQDGDKLVLFTDGVTEALNPDNEEFGEDRLMECLKPDALEPGVVLDRILRDVRRFCKQSEQGDDITVTVTRFR